MRTRQTARAAILSTLVVVAGAARASDLFNVNLAETGNPGNRLFVGSSSLPNLLENLADQTGAFASFNGVPFAANLTYAGIDNAIAIQYDPTGGANGGEVIRITSLLGSDATPTFDRANGDLGNQIRDFFLKDDPDAIKDFLKQVNRRSLVAVTDGNPLATTARSARYKFERFGIHTDFTTTEGELYNRFSVDHSARRARSPGANGGETPGAERAPLDNLPVHQAATPIRTRFHFAAQYIDAQSFDGYSFDLNTSFEYVFSEHVSAVLGFPVGYHAVEDADVFNGGVHIDVPVRFIIPDYGSPYGLTWQVTPGVSMDLSGSVDYAAGGVLWSGGVNNTFIFHLDRLRIVTSQQLTLHEGQKLKINDYEFDPGVSQQILKLGAKAAYSLTHKLEVYGGVTYTDFLKDSAIDHYWSPTAGFSFVFRNGANITVGYEGDFADDFERHGGRVGVTLPF
ncbi:MAG: hypothetical protein EA378_01500 [Phycisphaerales bacterium]|nr:MAG: hypothetical protein EA378_01500 [Phycisphaerales bacterium]